MPGGDSTSVEVNEFRKDVWANVFLTEMCPLLAINHHGLSRFPVNEPEHAVIDVQWVSLEQLYA